MKIPQWLKIAGAVIVVAIMASAVLMILGMSDVMSSQATGSEVLKPDGTAAGKALVVYNPGLSGDPRTVATRIANDLKTQGYEVTLAGVKSAAAANVSGYGVIVAGGPIYGGKVSPSVYSYLQSLAPPANAKVGAFACGTSVTNDGFPAEAWLKTTAVLNPGDSGPQARFLAVLLS